MSTTPTALGQQKGRVEEEDYKTQGLNVSPRRNAIQLPSTYTEPEGGRWQEYEDGIDVRDFGGGPPSSSTESRYMPATATISVGGSGRTPTGDGSLLKVGSYQLAEGFAGLTKLMTGDLIGGDAMEWLNKAAQEEISKLDRETQEDIGRQFTSLGNNSVWRDPDALVTHLIMQVPNLAMLLLPATMGAKLAASGAKAKVALNAAAKYKTGSSTLASLTPNAGAVAQRAALRYGKEAAAKGGAIAGAGAEGGIGTGFVYAEVHSAINEMSDEELSAESPEYLKYRNAGMSVDEAKSALSEKVGKVPALTVGALSAALGYLPGKMIGQAVSGSKKLSLKNIGRLAGTEATEEALQEGSEAVGANVAVPGRELTEGVAESMAQGATLGLFTGGGAATAAGVLSPSEKAKPPKDEPVTPTEEDIPADVQAAVQPDYDPAAEYEPVNPNPNEPKDFLNNALNPKVDNTPLDVREEGTLDAFDVQNGDRDLEQEKQDAYFAELMMRNPAPIPGAPEGRNQSLEPNWDEQDGELGKQYLDQGLPVGSEDNTTAQEAGAAFDEAAEAAEERSAAEAKAAAEAAKTPEGKKAAALEAKKAKDAKIAADALQASEEEEYRKNLKEQGDKDLPAIAKAREEADERNAKAREEALNNEIAELMEREAEREAKEKLDNEVETRLGNNGSLVERTLRKLANLKPGEKVQDWYRASLVRAVEALTSTLDQSNPKQMFALSGGKARKNFKIILSDLQKLAQQQQEEGTISEADVKVLRTLLANVAEELDKPVSGVRTGGAAQTPRTIDALAKQEGISPKEAKELLAKITANKQGDAQTARTVTALTNAIVSLESILPSFDGVTEELLNIESQQDFAQWAENVQEIINENGLKYKRVPDPITEEETVSDLDEAVEVSISPEQVLGLEGVASPWVDPEGVEEVPTAAGLSGQARVKTSEKKRLYGLHQKKNGGIYYTDNEGKEQRFNLLALTKKLTVVKARELLTNLGVKGVKELERGKDGKSPKLLVDDFIRAYNRKGITQAQQRANAKRITALKEELAKLEEKYGDKVPKKFLDPIIKEMNEIIIEGHEDANGNLSPQAMFALLDAANLELESAEIQEMADALMEQFRQKRGKHKNKWVIYKTGAKAGQWRKGKRKDVEQQTEEERIDKENKQAAKDREDRKETAIGKLRALARQGEEEFFAAMERWPKETLRKTLSDAGVLFVNDKNELVAHHPQLLGQLAISQLGLESLIDNPSGATIEKVSRTVKFVPDEAVAPETVGSLSEIDQLSNPKRKGEGKLVVVESRQGDPDYDVNKITRVITFPEGSPLTKAQKKAIQDKHYRELLKERQSFIEDAQALLDTIAGLLTDLSPLGISFENETIREELQDIRTQIRSLMEAAETNSMGEIYQKIYGSMAMSAANRMDAAEEQRDALDVLIAQNKKDGVDPKIIQMREEAREMANLDYRFRKTVYELNERMAEETEFNVFNARVILRAQARLIAKHKSDNKLLTLRPQDNDTRKAKQLNAEQFQASLEGLPIPDNVTFTKVGKVLKGVARQHILKRMIFMKHELSRLKSLSLTENATKRIERIIDEGEQFVIALMPSTERNLIETIKEKETTLKKYEDKSNKEYAEKTRHELTQLRAQLDEIKKVTNGITKAYNSWMSQAYAELGGIQDDNITGLTLRAAIINTLREGAPFKYVSKTSKDGPAPTLVKGKVYAEELLKLYNEAFPRNRIYKRHLKKVKADKKKGIVGTKQERVVFSRTQTIASINKALEKLGIDQKTLRENPDLHQRFLDNTVESEWLEANRQTAEWQATSIRDQLRQLAKQQAKTEAEQDKTNPKKDGRAIKNAAVRRLAKKYDISIAEARRLLKERSAPIKVNTKKSKAAEELRQKRADEKAERTAELNEELRNAKDPVDNLNADFVSDPEAALIEDVADEAEELSGDPRLIPNELLNDSDSDLLEEASFSEENETYTKIGAALREVLNALPVGQKIQLNKLLDIAIAAADDIDTRVRLQNLRDLNMNVPVGLGNLENSIGRYYGTARSIVLDGPRIWASPDNILTWALMHEAHHAAIDAGLTSDRAVALEMQRLYEYVVRKIRAENKGRMPYALTNLKEFLAEAHSNPEVQARLRHMDAPRGPFKTAWDWLLSIARRILGLPPVSRDSVLDRIMDARPSLLMTEEQTQKAKQLDLPSIGGLEESMLSLTPIIQTGQALWAHPRRTAVTNRGRGALLGFMTLRQMTKAFDLQFNGSLKVYQDLVFKKGSAIRKFQRRASELNTRISDWKSANPNLSTTIDKLFIRSTLLKVNPQYSFNHAKNAHLQFKSPKAQAQSKKNYDEVAEYYRSVGPAGQRLFLDVGEEFRRDWEAVTQFLKTNVFKKFDIKDPEGMALKVKSMKDISLLRDTEGNELSEATQKTIKHLIRRTQMQEGPYFPLRRFGDHVVNFTYTQEETGSTKAELMDKLYAYRLEDPSITWTKPEAEVEGYSTTITYKETQFHDGYVAAYNARQKLLADALKKGLPADSVGPVQKKRSFYESKDAVPTAGFLAHLEKKMGNSDPALLSQLKTVYLEMLPETSFRKAEMRRKGVPGIDVAQAQRAFATHSMQSAYFKAQLKFGPLLAEQMESMAKNATSGEGDTIAKQDVVTELKRRDAAETRVLTMNPILDSMSDVGFLWYLLSPSYSLINMTQVEVMTLPWLSARHGKKASWDAINSAYAEIFPDIFKASVDSYAGLKALMENATPEDFFNLDGHIKKLRLGTEHDINKAKMLEELVEVGLIDMSFVLSLRETAATQVGSTKASAWNSTIDMARTMPHLVEIMNRYVTSVAAYELAIKAKVGHDAAVEFAADAVSETQFDYSAANKPRFFSSRHYAAAGPIAMFKQFPQHVFANIIFAVKDAVGNDPVKKQQAKSQLLGMFGTHLAVAGVLGVIMEPIRWAIGLTMLVLGDEDDPFDLDTYIRQNMADMFGVTMGEIISEGLPNAIGINISDRVGLHNMLIMPRTGFAKEDRNLVENTAFAMLGPMAVLPANAWRGWLDIREGDYFRGVEQMMPKMLRDLTKTARYATQGLVDTAGNEILNSDRLDPIDLFYQSMGLQPSQVHEVHARRMAVKFRETRLDERTGNLMEQYRRADSKGRIKIMQDIRTYNSKNPQHRLEISRVIRNLQEQAKREDEARRNGGIYVSPKRRYLLQEGEFARVDR